ncbi:hypothetical protein SAMN04487783_0989 [Agrococcus baldri]|uniref:Uncharacterized protein n=1 Tax=Agrococcus baldri TaxID=153730 RepID=A0AA94HLM6_9MICO|nr:hypothetical protein [Agrococcus baldri]SFS07659.1 hypothetical protein SAMN04487783_0989 [Agrococcus baldri]
MDFLHSLLLATHLIGASLLVGTFFVQMRAKAAHNFTVMLVGASLQLLSGVGLYGLAMAGDGDPNHMKLGIKGLIALVVFVAALIGFLRQKAIRKEQATLKTGGAQIVADVAIERKLMPFFHAAGGLALVNLLIAVFW